MLVKAKIMQFVQNKIPCKLPQGILIGGETKFSRNRNYMETIAFTSVLPLFYTD
jgi:hypothetical protein